MASTRRYGWIGGMALGAAVLGAAIPAGAQASAAQATTWVTTKGKVVNLSLVAGYNNANQGMNFNGADKGTMVITIPLGDRVVVTFKNDAKNMPHNAAVIAYTTTLPAGEVGMTAFPGAETHPSGPPPGANGQGMGQMPGNGQGQGQGSGNGQGMGQPPAGAPPSTSSGTQTFSFVANKAGTYLIICEISGHARSGMWDTLVVSSTAKTASVSFK